MKEKQKKKTPTINYIAYGTLFAILACLAAIVIGEHIHASYTVFNSYFPKPNITVAQAFPWNFLCGGGAIPQNVCEAQYNSTGECVTFYSTIETNGGYTAYKRMPANVVGISSFRSGLLPNVSVPACSG